MLKSAFKLNHILGGVHLGNVFLCNEKAVLTKSSHFVCGLSSRWRSLAVSVKVSLTL